MATNGIQAMTPILVTLDTATSPYAIIDTVPNGKERTYLLARATNKTASDATLTLGVRLPGGAAGTEKFVAFNTPIKVGAPQNAFGPDVLGPLPAGTVLVGRASAAGAIDLVITGTERTL